MGLIFVCCDGVCEGNLDFWLKWAWPREFSHVR